VTDDDLTEAERRIKTRATTGRAQPAQDERKLPGRDWSQGPEKTPAQIEREARRADEARVAADMRSDACTWIIDPATGRRRPVRDWRSV
jgi:hypothetical protein